MNTPHPGDQDIVIGEAAHECLLEAELLHEFPDTVTLSISRDLYEAWQAEASKGVDWLDDKCPPNNQ